MEQLIREDYTTPELNNELTKFLMTTAITFASMVHENPELIVKAMDSAEYGDDYIDVNLDRMWVMPGFEISARLVELTSLQWRLTVMCQSFEGTYQIEGSDGELCEGTLPDDAAFVELDNATSNAVAKSLFKHRDKLARLSGDAS
jgi:hypothetical protein